MGLRNGERSLFVVEYLTAKNNWRVAAANMRLNGSIVYARFSSEAEAQSFLISRSRLNPARRYRIAKRPL